MRAAMRLVAAILLLSLPARAAEIARGDLAIRGLSLEVDTSRPIVTAIDVPAAVQTIFGGKTNDEAPPAPDLLALGDLSGPGIDTPITLSTQPGRQFQLPPLHQTGDYVLQNIRLADRDGRFLQQAVPSFASINVSDVFKTNIRVRQLTPDELRARGINVDSRNFDVFDVTIVVAIRDGEVVEVPYPIIVDRRTREIISAPGPTEQQLPRPTLPGPPPRFQPPDVFTVAMTEDLGEGGGLPPAGAPERNLSRPRPTIPAAIVLPAGFGVLHQFFSVILNVSNNAPQGASIVLDSITATMDAPLAMRVAKIEPPVAVGQPVPIRDKSSGNPLLVAQAEGSADWSLEALKAGTHTVTITIRATYKAENQPDIPLKAVAQAAIAVSDPRFQFNFVHPDNVRKDETYTAYAFITNTSASQQLIVVDTHEIPTCANNQYSNNICRVEGDPAPQITLAAGETKSIAYKLKTSLTGHAFAGAVSSEAGVDGSIRFDMGVSEHGIPLSAATLVLPYYAQFLPPALVQAHLGFFGLGYSLATAPLSPRTAQLPRILRTDLFQRAQDLARAGQRIFVARRDLSHDDPTEDREPIFHLALDLLGNVERLDRLANAPDLREWDQFRLMEQSARTASAAIADEMKRVGLAGGRSLTQLVDDFATATSTRSPYALAVVHGVPAAGASRSYALSVKGMTSSGAIDVPSATSEKPYVRSLLYGELTELSSSTEYAEAAIVGRWKESLEFSVVAASPSFTVDLVYPDAADGAFLRASLPLTNADPHVAVKIVIARGAPPVVSGAQVAGTLTATPVALPPLQAVAAAQDLHLDPAGHIVSLLFNRPVASQDRSNFALTTRVAAAAYEQTRRDVIPGAALQDDGRIVNITFDHSLSTNATYVVGVDAPQASVVPRIDNNAPGGIVYGKLLLGDNSGVRNTLVQLQTNGTLQFDTTLDDGSFIFEHVPRDIDHGIAGNYRAQATKDGKFAQVDGVVRTIGEVQRIVLQFLGRGTATGTVTYSDGAVIANAQVTGGSTIYNEFHQTTTDANGKYTLADLPVGPLTLAVTDSSGNVSYAATQIRVPGESIVQDLTIQKRNVGAGFGAVRVTVKRSDTSTTVAGAHVAVYTQGYGLVDGFTDATGRFDFTQVPAGFISVLASEFSLTRESAGADLDLRADTTIDVTLTLHVPVAGDPAPATLHGFVWRDDPTAPNNSDRETRVANAVVTIRNLASVTSGDNGEFTYTGVPVALSGKRVVTVFDPATGRQGSFSLPDDLHAGTTSEVKLVLRTTVAQGTATMRVRLLSAAGATVSSGYDVISPGFPPDRFEPRSNGIYERSVDVPQSFDLVAVPQAPGGPDGDQVAHGLIRADFNGQIAAVDLRLPGEGRVLARILVRKPCPPTQPNCPEEYDVAQGTVAVSYRVWDDVEQQLVRITRRVDADPVSGVATVTGIPAGEAALVETVSHPAGYAAVTVSLGFDGDTKQIELKLTTIGDVSGRVVSFDGQTPVNGATLRLAGSVNLGPVTTGADGTFRFAGVGANQGFRITADVTQDGVYRTGYVDAATPQGGGPVAGLAIVMRQQGSVSGRIVDNSGAAVPLARYWARELAWPYRSFGSPQDPLIASKDGNFFLNNIFSGPVRVSAASPIHQEDRGDWQGEIGFENDNKTGIIISVGGTGSGSVSITVVDSNSSFQRVPFAEVTLLRGGNGFDFAATDQNGLAFFENVPADNADYSVRVTSKSVGRSGVSGPFKVFADGNAQVQVVLDLLGRVAGNVVDGDVTPPPRVRGAPVFLYGSLSSISSTDGAGEFQFNGVPEGTFRLEALDLDSGRRAFSTGNLFISKLFPERTGIQLALERTATLNVKVYLPDDLGNAGALAPLVDVKVMQSNYSREQQGNDLNFAKMFARTGYHVEAKELGGEERSARLDGAFAPDAFTGTASLVFATAGTVEVRVSASDPALIAGAHVSIGSVTRGYTVFTDATGVVRVPGVSLGPISVQVTSSNLSASGGGNLVSHSTPLVINVTLGSRATVDGYVDAEAGGASAGTKVSIDVQSPALVGGSLHLETRTDGDGHYAFAGIPASATHVTLRMYGPDEVTVGASVVQDIPDGATGVVTMPRVRLDATPPRVLTIDPPNNANSVSPNVTVIVAFSERLSPSCLNSSNFQIVATDDNTPAPISLAEQLLNGQYRVRITPNGLLKSNVVYRIFIGGGVTDLSGQMLGTAVGSSFTTVNYTEPRIIRVDPSVDLPLGDGATFRLKFNKPVDAASGAIKLEQLDTNHGQRIGALSVQVSIDPVDPSTIVVAPTGVAIQPSSFYRLTASGVRDTQSPPNVQKEAQSFDFFSFDHVRPIVAIVSPLPAGFPLVAGVAYTAAARITDDGTTPSKDIQYVDWFEGDRFIVRAKIAPYTYNFAAPGSGTTYTLKASATDLSNNVSEMASLTWNLAPNNAPTDVHVTTTPSAVFLGGHVDAAVAFNDEGVAATVGLKVTGSHLDGTPYELPSARIKPSVNQQATRLAVDAAWPVVNFGVDLPTDLKEGEPLHFTATVTDSVNQATSSTTDVALQPDTVAPQVVSVMPASETRLRFGTTYRIAVQARDAESGVAHVVVTYDNKSVDLTTGSLDAASGVRTFTADVAVTAKNADTRVHIVATAYDHHGNTGQGATDVIYESVNDGTIPVAQWLTPLDLAALPAGRTMNVKLRVHATDDTHVEAVKFESPAFASAVADVTTASPADVFEANASINVPASGSFTITATVRDADPAHDVVLPISINAVAVDEEVLADAAVNAGNLSQYANKSLLVSGSATNLYVTVPLTLQNLIVIGGARVGNPDRVKLDLTVSGVVYIDGDSSIDLTAKGYLGGRAQSEDGVTVNDSQRGMTLSGDGPLNASGSYGGLAGGATNAPYGSIRVPSDFGTGGSGGSGANDRGANGGGAVALHGNKMVIAGAVRADGGSGVGLRYAGSGGSVLVTSQVLITGRATRITANGGDDDAVANGDAGGGGGRVAITASDRFDVLDVATQIQARGGGNGAGDEGKTYLDGGAGTILLLAPGAPLGELIVSSADERNAASTHQTRGSPLTGTLAFDAVTIGPRALARFDDDYTATITTVDPTAVLLTKADQPTISLNASTASVIQDTTFGVSFAATSKAGVGSVELTFGATTSVPFSDYPTSIPAATATLPVPFDAPAGPAPLKATVMDRAGRSAEASAGNIAIVANTPPTIDRFDVTPSSMYAGHSISVVAAASDDVAVRSLALTASVGTVTTLSPTTFSVAIPATSLGGTNVQLTLTASDGFPTRTPVTRFETVAILADATGPSVSITAPVAGATITEGSIINIAATIADAEVGVKQATASMDGITVPMTADPNKPNVWNAAITAPDVDGSAPEAKTITVRGADFADNPGTGTVTINVSPIVDPLAPTLAWVCNTSGALYPVGAIARLQLSAKPAPGDSVTSVAITVTDPNGASTYPMTSADGINYVYNYTVPAAAVDTAVSLRAVATTFGTKSNALLGSLTILANSAANVVFSGDLTIPADDASNDNKTVIVTSGKLTIAGPHTFSRLVVLNGASVVQLPTTATVTNRLEITASTIFVACGGSIDASGRGYVGVVNGVGRTYPNTNVGGSTPTSGGSHGGSGGTDNGIPAAVYGSIWDPNEPGGSGSSGVTTDTLPDANPGGGIIRLSTTTLLLDGKIAANGATTSRYTGGAGGSIRIDATTVNGSGKIQADGIYWEWSGGGGGRVALYYAGALGVPRSNITANAGTANERRSWAAAGTVYLRQVDTSTRAKVRDELIVDNFEGPVGQPTELPDLGSGTVTAVSGAVITLSKSPSPWLVGSYIDILSATGSVLSSYLITATSGNSVTVQLASGESAANAPVGSIYRGNLNLDAITIGSNARVIAPAIRGNNLTISGTIDTTDVTAQNLTLIGATLRQTPTTTAITNSLQINVAGTLAVRANSTVDASGRGYTGVVNGVGRTYPNTTLGGSTPDSGGSHGGIGGRNAGTAAAVYGSLWDPNEPGGSGSTGNPNSTVPTANPGGGIIRISAVSLLVDGKILAHGATTQDTTAGAGGSIRIDAPTISGAGQIRADGVYWQWAGGGGGRVAVYYTGNLGVPLANISAIAGQADEPARYAAAGTVYLKRNNQVYGDLVVDSGANFTPPPATQLLSVGSGTITAVTSSTGGAPDTIVDASAQFPSGNFLAGNRIFFNNDKSVLWKIKSHTSTSLILDTSTAPLNAQAGQTYAGLYRFDSLTIRNATVASYDAIESLAPTDTSRIIVNAAAPTFDASRIQLVSTSDADTLAGSSGAVTDSDTPIRLIATNIRTGVKSATVTAAANGSFSIPVSGLPGDRFTLTATDGSPLPLSRTIDVPGEIANTNAVDSLTAQPQSVTGGGTIMFGVRLIAPARYPVVVALSSSDSTVAVPTAITVPVGAASASFNATTTNPLSTVKVTIVAAIAGQSRTVTVTVIPAANVLLSIGATPASVQGGSAVNGTATLGAPAPAGGAVVSLTSSNSAAATVPPQVAILEGASSASFSVTTVQVASSTQLAITGVYGATQSATLNVTPCTSMQPPAPPSATAIDRVWVDDALPAGATSSGSGEFTSGQAAVGVQSVHIPAAIGARNFSFSGGATLSVGGGDKLVSYVLLNPCNPPRQIVFVWTDGTTEYRTSWGEDLIEPQIAHTRVGSLPAAGEWTRLETLASIIGAASKTLTSLTIKVYDGELWLDQIGTTACSLAANVPPPASFGVSDVVLVDDDTPAGITLNAPWTWDGSQRVSGAASVVIPLATGLHQRFYISDPNPVRVNSGDILFAYVLLDPCNPPRQVMLQWNDGSDWHRAYWGEDALEIQPRFRVGALPETGNWVRLEVPAAQVGLNEARIYGAAFTLIDGRAWFDRSGKATRVNLALRKSARQSSDLNSTNVAGLAVDGNVASVDATMARTQAEANPWWEVDLGSVTSIESVEVRGRTDCCANQTADIYTFVSDTPITASTIGAAKLLNGISSYYAPNSVDASFTIDVHRTGRYVRLWKSGTDVLSLPEVLVWASAMPSRSNLAGGKPTSSSPIYQGTYLSEWAVNGSAYDFYGSTGRMFHSTDQTEPYWDVDLGRSESISTIEVHSRYDCCPEQLTNYYVLTSDQPFASTALATTLADARVSAWYQTRFLPVTSIPINRTARYIRLQRNGSGNFLVFTEVQAWSQSRPIAPLAIPQPAAEAAKP